MVVTRADSDPPRKQDDGSQVGYHVELTRGRTFYPATFDERVFGASHQHCINCGKTIQQAAQSGAESSGYVTLRELQAQDGRRGLDFRWVCSECFPKLQEPMRWILDPELPPLKAPETQWARRPRRSPADLENFFRNYPYALVGWDTEEVQSIARSSGYALSDDQAVELLEANERKLEGIMTSAGHKLLKELVTQAFNEITKKNDE